MSSYDVSFNAGKIPIWTRILVNRTAYMRVASCFFLFYGCKKQAFDLPHGKRLEHNEHHKDSTCLTRILTNRILRTSGYFTTGKQNYIREALFSCDILYT